MTPGAESEEEEKERRFLDIVRRGVWPHAATEDQCVPSRRCQWVLSVWRQAHLSSMNVPPLEGNGWAVDGDNVDVVWDTADGVQAAQDPLDTLRTGCRWRSGCMTRRCRCQQAGKVCTLVCKCCNCANKEVAILQQEMETTETAKTRGEGNVLQNQRSSLFKNNNHYEEESAFRSLETLDIIYFCFALNNFCYESSYFNDKNG